MAEENKDQVKLDAEMSEEERTALQENEDFILNFKDEDLDDPDKQAELAKRLKDAQTTVHQKRHYRTKVDDLTKKLEDSKPKDPPEVKKPEKKDDAVKGIDPNTALTFRIDHPEIPKAVVKEILEYAGNASITPEEAAEKSFFKTRIKEEKDKEDIEAASLTPGGKGTPEGGKKDWSTASETEVQAQRNRILNGGQ